MDSSCLLIREGLRCPSTEKAVGGCKGKVPRILTEGEIQDLIDEQKTLPPDWHNALRLKPKRSSQYDEREIPVHSVSGELFRIIARRNRQNQLDFSVILVFEDTDGSEYRLVRYNGKHPSRHSNKWEKDQGREAWRIGPDFHMHRATERYQKDGYAIDGYAEVTDAYCDFGSAVEAFLAATGFRRDDPLQGRLL